MSDYNREYSELLLKDRAKVCAELAEFRSSFVVKTYIDFEKDLKRRSASAELFSPELFDVVGEHLAILDEWEALAKKSLKLIKKRG